MTEYQHGDKVRIEFDANYYSRAFMGSHVVDADRDHRCTVPDNAVQPRRPSRATVDLPQPTARDGDHHAWHLGVKFDEMWTVHTYLDPIGRPVVEVHDENGDVLLSFGPDRARELFAAGLAACDRAEQSADALALAKQDAKEAERGNDDWKAAADAFLAVFPECAAGTCDCDEEPGA
ncbi:MAG TPA: hypothetical protein VFV67_33995 [Actinophytocola sp.]|uniref:hypothetical protein n=1 Tax=Actinophytocola sp. TaxID=1872138 RepID=UPI002DB661CB|nr:hypothetical protein [Actinophytocola sp.]HEU5475680.1 hypothetical protein [Actinophytocola sp.]